MDPFFKTTIDISDEKILERIQENMQVRQVLNLPPLPSKSLRGSPIERLNLRDANFQELDNLWHKILEVDSPYSVPNGGLKGLVKSLINKYHKLISSSQYYFNSYCKRILEQILESIRVLDYNNRVSAKKQEQIYEKVKSDTDALREIISSQQTQIEGLERQISQLGTVLKKIESHESQISTIAKTTQGHEKSIDKLDQRLTQSNERTKKRLSDLDKSIAKQDSKHQVTDRALQSVRTESANLGQEVSGISKDLQRAGKRMDRQNEAFAKLEESHEELQKRFSGAMNDLDQLSSNLAGIQEDLSGVSSVVDQDHTAIGKMEKNIEKALASLRDNLTDCVNKQNDLSNRSHDLEQAVTQVAKDLDEKQAVLETEIGKCHSDFNKIGKTLREDFASALSEGLESLRVETGNNASGLVQLEKTLKEDFTSVLSEGLETLRVETGNNASGLVQLESSLNKGLSSIAENTRYLRSFQERLEGNEKWSALIAQQTENGAIHRGQLSSRLEQLERVGDKLNANLETYQESMKNTLGLLQEANHQQESFDKRVLTVEKQFLSIDPRLEEHQKQLGNFSNQTKDLYLLLDRAQENIHKIREESEAKGEKITELVRLLQQKKQEIESVKEIIQKNVEMISSVRERLESEGAKRQEILEKVNAEALAVKEHEARIHQILEKANAEALAVKENETRIHEILEKANAETLTVKENEARIHNIHEKVNAEALAIKEHEARIHEILEKANAEALAVQEHEAKIHSLSANTQKASSDMSEFISRYQNEYQVLESARSTIEQQIHGLEEGFKGTSDWAKLLADRVDGCEKWTGMLAGRMDHFDNVFVGLRSEMLSEVHYSLNKSYKPVESKVPAPEEYAKKIAAQKKTGYKINLGCGGIPVKDFINIDMREMDGVDLVADITDLPFNDKSVAELYSAHLIEHFPEFEMKTRILPKWMKLLKNGGTFRVVTPNWGKIIEGYNAGKIPFERMKEITFGGQDTSGNFHYSLYTVDTLTEMLADAGLKDIEVVAEARDNYGCPEMELKAVKKVTRSRVQARVKKTKKKK